MTKVSVTAMAILMLTMNATTSQATGINKATNVISYLGNIESYPVFELKMDNLVADEYDVKITDINSHILYQENLKGTNLTRKYRLDVDVEDLKNIRFTVTSKSTKETRTYQIVNNSYVVSDVFVTKL